MSYYIHKRVIRARITEEIYERLNKRHKLSEDMDWDDIVKKIDKSFPYFRKEKDYFEIVECSSVQNNTLNLYLDFVSFCFYGGESSEWYNVTKLSNKNYRKFEPIFERMLGEFGVLEKNSLCEVDYCWCNCSVPDDAYEEYVYKLTLLNRFCSKLRKI